MEEHVWVKATVKRWGKKRGYGFLAVPGQKNDVFLHISVLRRCGFSIDDAKEGQSAIIDYVPNSKGENAILVHQLGGNSAPNITRKQVDRRHGLLLVRVDVGDRRHGHYIHRDSINGPCLGCGFRLNDTRDLADQLATEAA